MRRSDLAFDGCVLLGGLIPSFSNAPKGIVMKHVGYRIGVVLSCSIVVGCSSPQPRERNAIDQSRADEVYRQAEADRLKVRQTEMEREISAIPAWALQAPKPDAVGVYAAGIAESDNLVVASRKAMLEAEFGLAKLYGQEISGGERSLVDEDGRAVSARYQGLIDKLVSRVPVVGFEVVQQEVKPLGGRYHAFVLLKLPYAEFNRVLRDVRTNERDKTFQSAFADLERRLNSREKARREDAAAARAAADAGGSQQGASTSAGGAAQSQSDKTLAISAPANNN